MTDYEPTVVVVIPACNELRVRDAGPEPVQPREHLQRFTIAS